MKTQRDQNRVYFIDYLRGLMVLYVVLDHAMHLYSPHFKKFHRFQDFGGNLFFDIWHMHNDVIMMPFLYFLAGMFILPSLHRRGWLSFAKEKANRLLIPFLFGVAIIVPPQTYISHLINKTQEKGYFSYWFTEYFTTDLSSSAFWFLAYLALLTVLLLVIHTLFPAVIKGLGRFANWLVTHPIKGFLCFALIGAVLIGASEIIWSSQWWIGFWKLFYVRGSRFLMKAFLFFLGAGFAHAGITRNDKILTAIGGSWKTWVVLSLIAGSAYITYALTNFYTGAYSMEIVRHFHYGGTWSDIGPILDAYGGPILIRTSLMALFMCSLVVMYIALFKRFADHPLPKWQSLATCSFGIYIFHEPMVHLVQYYYLQSDVSEYIKFIASAGVATALSWGLTHMIKGWPGFRKVL